MSAIDLSRLDQETRDKIAACRKRCAELAKGVNRDIDIKWKIGAGWNADGEPSLIELQNQPDWDSIKLAEEEFLREIKNEVKQIVCFCMHLACQLGVEATHLWDQEFAV